MKSNLFVLLLVMCAAGARDPFLPAGTSPCSLETETTFPWRLQGVIGRPDNYQAWLRSPTSIRQHVAVNDLLPDGGWRVTQIDLHSVSLTDSTQCQPSLTLHLKGVNKDVKDNSHSAAVRQPHQSGG